MTDKVHPVVEDNGMKVFIWNNPYSVAYGGSFLFVVAGNEEQARNLAASAHVTHYGYPPRERNGQTDLGEPDRVIEAPYAEIYEWSE